MTAPGLRKISHRQSRRKQAVQKRSPTKGLRLTAALALIGMISAVPIGLALERYTISLQSPVRVHLQWPVVITERAFDADAARADQHGRRLSAHQQYACQKFGMACRVALAIQRAENPKGACEIYHYNADGTLDWGYFQINTVHLHRPGVNLRDLLDCKANIDFAYQLYQERGFEPWTTYNTGAYRKFMNAAR